MKPDDHVCICFHVSLRKIVNFCRRERPVRVSLLSECLSAGTGCGWCIPFLKTIYNQVWDGVPSPDLPVSPEEYAERRAKYRITGSRDEPTPIAKPSRAGGPTAGPTASPAAGPPGEPTSPPGSPFC
ncbi:MAG: (2Fe-2S)-binding protein [Planctomycetes bacterium]|nr:(2Fe-2S)-binding protein [Planctomycetota bacterium]